MSSPSGVLRAPFQKHKCFAYFEMHRCLDMVSPDHGEEWFWCWWSCFLLWAFGGFPESKYLNRSGLFTADSHALFKIKGGPTTVPCYLCLCLCLYRRKSHEASFIHLNIWLTLTHLWQRSDLPRLSPEAFCSLQLLKSKFVRQVVFKQLYKSLMLPKVLKSIVW